MAEPKSATFLCIACLRQKGTDHSLACPFLFQKQGGEEERGMREFPFLLDKLRQGERGIPIWRQSKKEAEKETGALFCSAADDLAMGGDFVKKLCNIFKLWEDNRRGRRSLWFLAHEKAPVCFRGFFVIF